MSAERPFALHVTWTCYGTWLPGDERGYVSNTRLPGGGFDPKQNTPGTPCTQDDPLTRELAVAAKSHPTVWLTCEQAACIALSLIQLAGVRGWRILRAAVMANHIHVVLTDCPDDGPIVRRILKGVTQADLSRYAGEPRRWWTQGGSDRHKHDHTAIETAIRYVADQPGMLAGVDDMRPFIVEPNGELRYLDMPDDA